MKKDQAFIKNVALVIANAATVYSGAPIVLQAASLVLIAAYGFHTDIFPEESKDLLKRLEKVAPNLKNQIINSKEFQQALAITYESLARTPDVNKRKIIKAVFFDEYISTEDRHNIELERLYRITQEISIEALEHLKFIEQIIIPKKGKMISKQIQEMNKENREGNDEWWYKLEYYRKPDSQVIQQWIYEEYNSNSPQVKAYAPNENTKEWRGWMAGIGDKERKIEARFAELAAELISLGIFKSRGDGTYTLSEFGQKFIKYAKIYPSV